MIDINKIEPLKVLIKNALMDEWKAQGHFMDGKIVDEMDILVEQDMGRTSLIGMMYPYGTYIDRGVDAGNIPFSPGSGAKKSAYIDGLISFVEKRMAVSSLREARSIAFAIAHTQKREGMPTVGSYKYSSTGSRKAWVNNALTKNKDKIGAYIRQFYREYMTAEFENVITKHITKI